MVIWVEKQKLLKKSFKNLNGDLVEKKLSYFTWEKLDYIEKSKIILIYHE